MDIFFSTQSPTLQNNWPFVSLKVESLCHFVSDTWEWEDGKGNWTEYSKPTVYLLEAAVLFGLTSIRFKEDKKELMVDLTKKVQTTKAGRAAKNVHRIKACDAGTVGDKTPPHRKCTLSVGVQNNVLQQQSL